MRSYWEKGGSGQHAMLRLLPVLWQQLFRTGGAVQICCVRVQMFREVAVKSRRGHECCYMRLCMQIYAYTRTRTVSYTVERGTERWKKEN